MCKGGGPMRSLTWTRLGLAGVLLLGVAAQPNRPNGEAKGQPALEIMSLDREDCSLRLSFRRGEMAVNHVLFKDQMMREDAIVIRRTLR